MTKPPTVGPMTPASWNMLSSSVAAVIGSVREGNYTSKAVHLLADEFATSYPEVTSDIVDPRQLYLPASGLDEEGDAQKVRDILNPATAVVLATPEYHRSYSSVIKLVIENLGFPSGLSGKPVAMPGVAVGAHRCHQVP